MKHISIFTLCLLVFSQAVYAQFAVINDSDGYTNLRQEDKSTSLVLTQITNKEAFWVYHSDDQQGSEGWKFVAFNRPGEEKTKEGYIHESRITPIATFKELKPFPLSPTYFAFSDGETILEIKTGRFDPTAHLIGRHEGGWAETIDGKKIRGTDGELPKQEIKWITLIEGEEKYEIPPEEFANFYEPNLSMKAYKDPDGKLYLTMNNSDGAGAYVAVMVFQDGKLLFQSAVIPF